MQPSLTVVSVQIKVCHWFKVKGFQLTKLLTCPPYESKGDRSIVWPGQSTFDTKCTVYLASARAPVRPLGYGSRTCISRTSTGNKAAKRHLAQSINLDIRAGRQLDKTNPETPRSAVCAESFCSQWCRGNRASAKVDF